MNGDRQPPQTNRRIALLLMVGLSFVGCTLARDETAPEANMATEQNPSSEARGETSLPAVELTRATSTTQQRSIQVAGRIAPRTRLDHEVPIAGLIRSVAVVPGTRVSAGTELFTVERTEVGQTFRPVVVTARIDGVVSEVAIQPSQEVRAGDRAITIVGQDGYVLEAQISDRYAFSVAVGERVSGTSPDGRTATGQLTRRSQEPDYQTGLFGLTFSFPVQAGLSIGSFLIIDLPTETITGIFVPREAIERRYGRSYVWTVDETEEPAGRGELQRREIETGATFGELLEIAEGLAAGERYLQRPTGRERVGQAVQIRPDNGSGES